MRINYYFNDPEAFLAGKETGSFHLAAGRLNLSQSAVTRRVQKLETALDTTLFERTTRAVKPTLAAKRLQTRAEAILDDALETTLAMRDESVTFEHQRNAVVTVAVIPTIVGLLLPQAIQAFRAAGHAARFRLLEHTANGVAEAVAKAEADFGISSIPELEPNTTFEPLFDDQIVIVFPKPHSLAQRQTITWNDFAHEDLIVPARGTGNRLLIDEAMAKAGLPLHWTCEFRRSTTALELVSQGIGLALLPKSALFSYPTDVLHYKEVTAPHILRPIGLLSRNGQNLTRSAQSFQDILRRLGQQTTPSAQPNAT